MNALVEPLARAGLLSGPVCALGVISLETTGRRTGKAHRVPVLAMSAGEYVLVATVRGERSDWFRNIEQNSRVRFWRDGHERAARATVPRKPGRDARLPAAVAETAAAMTSHARLMGWRFAVLTPEYQ
jgi:deazaflavin-dependent oxidoreductase (nitroreductase family)